MAHHDFPFLSMSFNMYFFVVELSYKIVLEKLILNKEIIYMAFGFFKKSEAADLIIKGGKIYTMDPDFPCAEAVACKGGTILAVGDTDAIEAFEDENTEVIDLEAGYMLPGLIDTYGHPVFKSFENTCLFLTEATNLESIITQIKGYVSKNQDKESYYHKLIAPW